MNGNWNTLSVLRAARTRVSEGESDCPISAIRSLRDQVPAPMRDRAYHSLMDTLTMAGEPASLSGLEDDFQPKVLALFDATIKRLASELH